MMYLISILWFGIDHNNILSHCLHNKMLSPQLILGKSKHEIYIPNPGKNVQLKKKNSEWFRNIWSFKVYLNAYSGSK